MATRLGGDEFVVLLRTGVTEDSATSVAERVIAELAQNISVDARHQVRVGASVGIALSDPHHRGDDAESLLHDADTALYRAKAEGRGRYVMFGTVLREQITSRAELETELVDGIADGQLRLHYQPVMDLASGDLTGYEALVRWERPGHGLVLPGEFLPVAEASDLVCEVDSWVLAEATSQLAAWSTVSGRDDLTMAVNLSGRLVGHRRLREDVLRALDRAGVQGRQLVVEVPESAVLDDAAAVRHLREVRALGVRVSLDDFGTGTTSVADLARLPVDLVKISRALLDHGSESSLSALRLQVQAAQRAGLTVVGGGVERFEQLAVLQELACQAAQGHFLGRPMTAEELEAGVPRLAPAP